MAWNDIESYGVWQWTYFITRIISAKTLWLFSTTLFKWIIEYQWEKPEEEQSDLDILMTDSAVVAMIVNFWFCMIYVSSIYIPIPLNENSCLWVGYVSYFLILLILSSLAITIYIKMVMVFQPEDVENVNIKKLYQKALLWKAIIMALTGFVDWLINFPQLSPIMAVLTKDYKTQA